MIEEWNLKFQKLWWWKKREMLEIKEGVFFSNIA
jgi:hypothetical protein